MQHLTLLLVRVVPLLWGILVDTTRTIACHIMQDIVDACVTKMYLRAHPIVLPGDTHQDNELDTRHAEGTPHKTMS